MATYGKKDTRKGIKLGLDDVLSLVGLGDLVETDVTDSGLETDDIASAQDTAESIKEVSQQSNLFTDVVQGVKDVSSFVKDVKSFLPNQTLRLLDDLTRRNSPAMQLNDMFSDIRISAPALSRLSEQPVSPFLQEPEQSPLNDFINMMRQSLVR